ncbi:MAG: hypothetical protein HZB98_06265 [Bacteroidia bacterium]|nr:hypothetical protein [Bacteroidia bacterium]
METKHFTLGNNEDSRLIKIIRILFGATCIGIAGFWLIFNTKSITGPGTGWITVLFLSFFGFYQIWAGLGKAERYIAVSEGAINLKKFIFLPAKAISASETQKIEFYPLKVRFILKTGKAIILRFGTTYYESNEKVIDELSEYAERNNIPSQVIEEEL